MARCKLLAISLVCLVTSTASAADRLWQEVQSPQVQSASTLQSRVSGAPPVLRRYRVDDLELRASLQRVTALVGPGSQQVIALPMPDGSIADFEIYEAPVMAEALARKYPDIRTFKVYGIDDPLASGRLSISPRGFRAMLQTSEGRLFLDPHDLANQPGLYDARTQESAGSSEHYCAIDDMNFPAQPQSSTTAAARVEARSSNRWRRYRIAISATEQYVDEVYNPVAAGTPTEQAQDEIVIAIARVSQIYERDLGVTFELVADNDDLIDTNGNAGLDNNNTQVLFNQNQLWIDSQLGSGAYDVGHAFSTGGGGLGWLGGACDDDNKARGVSGISNPRGDPFYVDFVAHEIGHQFNADHTFNGSTRSCGTARNASTAFEPGSGTTIMGYAGICGAEDLQNNSDDTFHAGSIRQINRFIDRGGSCFQQVNAAPSNPSHPVVSGLSSKSIPATTPFLLDTTATDADGDTLLYQWDQMDVGCPTDDASLGTDTGSNPLFRSYPPRQASVRHFPALGTLLEGRYDDAEVLPCQARDLNFRLTVRDDRSGVDQVNVTLSVEEKKKNFRVRTFNSTGQTVTNPASFLVEWNVADTDRAPINCSLVDIELMTLARSGGRYQTYTLHPLAMGTPNDGNELVAINPASDSHPRARIRIKCSNNYFFDISDADFVIDGTNVPTTLFDDSANLVFYNDNSTVGNRAPSCPAKVSCGPDDGVNPFDGSGRGSSALDISWLLLLSGLAFGVLVARRKFRVRSVT